MQLPFSPQILPNIIDWTGEVILGGRPLGTQDQLSDFLVRRTIVLHSANKVRETFPDHDIFILRHNTLIHVIHQVSK